jgi:hypothetical protein
VKRQPVKGYQLRIKITSRETAKKKGEAIVGFAFLARKLIEE